MISPRSFLRLALKSAAISLDALTFAATGAVSSALAQASGQQAVLLGTFGNWGAYSANAGGTKVCYALSQPSERRPDTLRRGPGYIFVSYRPSENVSNEIAVVMGFPTQDGQSARGVVDGAPFTFVTRGENAWMADAADESRIVDAFVRGRQLELNVTSARGNATTDIYSLSGFTAAMRRAQQECS
jgi:invasion protein IalB